MNSLKSRPSLQVFYELTLGLERPIDISKSLNKTPSAIIQQMKHMQKIGIIENREGSYTINWNRFVEVVLKSTPILSKAIREWKTEEPKKIPISLSKNKSFRNLVNAYYQILAKRSRTDYYITASLFGTTLEETIETFEKTLVDLSPLTKSSDEIFSNILEGWYVIKLKSEEYDPMREALNEISCQIEY